ncbi:hypothetical protein Tco_0146945 [Tanacetum coccineum]
MAIGLGQQMGSCTKPSDEMISCAIKGKLLVLSWGRTPRLDSDMRSGTLVGQGSVVIMTTGMDSLLRALVGPRKARGGGL